MRYLLILLIASLSSCGNTIFIVRHAEKEPVNAGAMMMDASDPPLSAAGRERALALREELTNSRIKHIFSTPYKRTISTADPLSKALGNLPIQIYSAKMDSMDAFIRRLRSVRKGNVLVVGHSNTIDDMANRLCGTTVVAGDLKDAQYDNLYEIKRRGSSYTFTGKKFGVRTE